MALLIGAHQYQAHQGRLGQIEALAALGLLLSGSLLPFYAHTEPIRQAARGISAPLHVMDFAAGIVDTRTVVWYLSSTVLLLFISIRILEARRLR